MIFIKLTLTAYSFLMEILLFIIFVLTLHLEELFDSIATQNAEIRTVAKSLPLFLVDSLSIIYESVRRKADFYCLEANVMRLFYNFTTGRSFVRDILIFLEALCFLLVCEKRRKFIHRIDKSWRNGLHAYAWDCYPTSVYKGIPDHLHTKT